MNLRTLWDDDHLFWGALALSLTLHVFVSFKAGEYSLHYRQKHTVEIDITNMGHLGMTTPHAPATAAPRPKASPKPIARPKEWTKPAPNQKVEPAPIPTKPVVPAPEEPPPPAPTSPDPAKGEYGIGTGDTSSNVLSRIPQLLNLSDLTAILQRFYPEDARSQGRESTVVLDIHIDTDGHVTSAEVVRSGGSDFDEAAKKAVTLLHFTPAFLGSQRVNVKMRQAIRFKLQE